MDPKIKRDGDRKGIGIEFDPPIPLQKFNDMVQAIIDPGGFTMEMAMRWSKICAEHDPCEDCGHGRFVHGKQNYARQAYKDFDATMTAEQCRHNAGRESACVCLRWRGTETPMPASTETP